MTKKKYHAPAMIAFMKEGLPVIDYVNELTFFGDIVKRLCRFYRLVKEMELFLNFGLRD